MLVENPSSFFGMNFDVNKIIANRMQTAGGGPSGTMLCYCFKLGSNQIAVQEGRRYVVLEACPPVALLIHEG